MCAAFVTEKIRPLEKLAVKNLPIGKLYARWLGARGILFMEKAATAKDLHTTALSVMLANSYYAR